ncbi:MAG: YjjG family noncanonical pyrimidine nucleotidase [Fulvivirga sp.]|nr:YjjG family noncanonical pyrimidine nucleotidase [Fulvivirga sp.]
MSNYRVIFFDLDHTLWDYDKNSVEALSDLYEKYELKNTSCSSLNHFLDTFTKVNSKLWNNYNKGHIDREQIRESRFTNILKTYGINDKQMALSMSEEYIEECPKKTHVFPYTFDALNYLKQKYELYILTNGFDDVQQVKLSNAQLLPYFRGMITSDSSGHRKPSREIFHYALNLAGAVSSESIMIGDNPNTDIQGAHAASIDSVLFNPLRKKHQSTVKHEISCLSELMEIL